MSQEFSPDGQVLYIDGIEISATGVGGRVELYYPSGSGMRAAEQVSDAFVKALAACDIQEQLTLEIDQPVQYADHYAPDIRGGAADKAHISLTVPGPGTGLGQLMLVCDEDGIVSWHYPEDINPGEFEARAADQRRYRISMDPVAGDEPRTRGFMGALGKKLVKLFTYRLIDKALGAASDVLVSHWEKLHRKHRLRLFLPNSYRQPGAAQLDLDGLKTLASGPALLFIHGTMSQSSSAFGKLPPDWLGKLCERYQGRVFAFEHPSLSVTPYNNARWLVEQLPPELSLQLDVVSHSRGGLVARVLSEKQAELGLAPGRLNIRQLIMVATPNAGTPLAERNHLGTFVDTMTNLLDLVPDNPVTDVLEVILTLAKQLAVGAMGGLDGLMSMDPDNAFLKDLNRPGSTKPGTRYHALAANFEANANASLARYAREQLTDLIFKFDPNDLVVPTRGVYEHNGAANFPIADPLVFAEPDAVDHSGYWTQARTLAVFDDWLRG